MYPVPAPLQIDHSLNERHDMSPTSQMGEVLGVVGDGVDWEEDGKEFWEDEGVGKVDDIVDGGSNDDDALSRTVPEKVSETTRVVYMKSVVSQRKFVMPGEPELVSDRSVVVESVDAGARVEAELRVMLREAPPVARPVALRGDGPGRKLSTMVMPNNEDGKSSAVDDDKSSPIMLEVAATRSTLEKVVAEGRPRMLAVDDAASTKAEDAASSPHGPGNLG